MSRSRRAGPLGMLSILVLLACGTDERTGGGGKPGARPDSASSAGTSSEPTAAPASRPGFVGSATCGACHPAEAQRWQGSQHRRAMAYATRENVAAPFSGETLREGAGFVAFVGGSSGRFWVDRDPAAGGRPQPGLPADSADLRVSATFGVEPLQQFLLDGVEGRIQVLPWAFDTRPAEQGGQRWIHLHPEAGGDESHPLHFSRPAQNWNHVCADCHLTAYRKRFNVDRGKFESRWEEFGVGCEGCHGPGQAHTTWAASLEGVAAGSERPPADRGLVARLDERRGIGWRIDPETGNAVRSAPRTTSRELEVCAQCHARRSAITEDYVAGEPFLDHYRPALLERGLYHVDGQQLDEVYAWGSFLQSRMHAKGVTCSDCHDPHSGSLRAEGDALCAGCHAPEKYARSAHHRHAPASAGSACTACHMPTTTYMQVDARHDHSLRVPRPDQARALGVPDACSSCHGAGRSDRADAAVRRWLGRPARGFERHAEAFQAGDSGAIGAGAGLRSIARDASQPTIVRASALARLDASRSRANAEALIAGTRDADALVRLGALEGLASAPPELRLRAAGLLGDPRRALRFEAVQLLADQADSLPTSAHPLFERESLRYVESLRRDADRPEARTRLAVHRAERGDAQGARRELEAALAIEPAFEPAWVNLADLERALGREDEARAVLDRGLAILPGSAVLHHARGLARIRLGEAEQALEDLARAVRLAPESTRFAYVEAVARETAGDRAGALARLEALARDHPGDVAVREALVGYLEAEGRLDAARVHRAALAEIGQLDP